MVKKIILTIEQEKAICDFYNSLENLCGTARHFKLSRTAIKRVLLKNNISIRPQKIPLSEDIKQEIVDFYLASGDNLKKTAQNFKLSRSTIRRVLNEKNIKINSSVKKHLSLEEEVQIINFYLIPTSLKETSKQFKLHPATIKRILAEHSIPLHSKELTTILSVQKFKETNLERYGTECHLSSPIIKEKSMKTCREKYGVNYYNQTQEFKDRTKKTNLEKYGCENVFQSKEFQEKIKQTMLNRYGEESYSKTTEFKDKILASKRLHGTFNISQPEEDFYNNLIQLFSKDNIIRQYNTRLFENSERYPFACDFYIKSLDLFIELNLS